jgi:hypothetical protein
VPPDLAIAYDTKLLLWTSIDSAAETARFADLYDEFPEMPAVAASAGVALIRLVEPDGIEPTTSCLQSRRSPN